MLTLYSDERALARALALIESGNDNTKQGDLTSPDGPAIGAFQIHQHAWNEISDMRKRQGKLIHPYHDAYKGEVAQEYAITFIRAILDEFRLRHLAPPSAPLLYSCYSLGPSVLPKIRYMSGIIMLPSPYDRPLIQPIGLPHSPLMSIGYDYKLARRKMATGQRFENLLYAHHQSLRESGIALLW